MREVLTHRVFLASVLLAMTNQVMEKGGGIFVPLIHGYLDDLLCFPIVLSLGLAMYRYFRPHYRLTHWHVWPTVLLYSVYFELYLPARDQAFTADVFDVVMYVAGSVVFLRWVNRLGSDLSLTGIQNG